jgi:AraC-like DNA-binding protein
MELISATEMVIATNNGLFRFNTVNKVLSPLIRGVEFNRKAMYKKGDLLQVGSINGLYSINVNDLELLASRNRYLTEKEQVPLHVIIGAISALAAIGLLAFLLFRSRRKLVIASAEIKELNIESLDRAKIEQYIRENLTTVSIKSITNHFDTNISHVYKLINPDKPGSIIQKLRIEKLVELKNAGKTVAEIAEATGLSTSYVVKIKNRSKLDD